MRSLLMSLLVLGVPLVTVTYRDRVRQITEAIDRCRMRAGLSEKYCAACVEIDESQWTKQRALGGILGRLVALPREFWREFLPALGQIVGVPVVLQTDDERLEGIVRRAIKAELHQETGCASPRSSVA